MGVVGEDESEEEIVGVIHEDAEDAVSSILLNQLGQAGRSHRREFSQNYRKLVSEIYSPPRITEEIKKGRYRKLAPGQTTASHGTSAVATSVRKHAGFFANRNLSF